METIRNVRSGDTWSLEGEVYFGLFETYIGFGVEDSASIEYVGSCATYLNSMSDALIDHLCEASIRYCNDFLDRIGEPQKTFSMPREVLGLITPICLLVPNPEHGEEPVIHLELNCKWEVEHGLEWVARRGSALYVGPFNGEHPWADYSQKDEWNYA
ncbi:MAG: hypothetical protein AB7Q81_12855 [Gammaproteobacteria bacterium]